MHTYRYRILTVSTERRHFDPSLHCHSVSSSFDPIDRRRRRRSFPSSFVSLFSFLFRLLLVHFFISFLLLFALRFRFTSSFTSSNFIHFRRNPITKSPPLHPSFSSPLIFILVLYPFPSFFLLFASFTLFPSSWWNSFYSGWNDNSRRMAVYRVIESRICGTLSFLLSSLFRDLWTENERRMKKWENKIVNSCCSSNEINETKFFLPHIVILA